LYGNGFTWTILRGFIYILQKKVFIEVSPHDWRLNDLKNRILA